MITVNCIGHGYTSKQLLAAIPAAKAGSMSGIAAAVLLVERRAKLIVTEKHIIDTGNLRSKIQPAVEDATHGTVTSGADYSLYIEYGHHTRGGGSWVEARPYMRPALDEEREQIAAVIGHAVAMAVRTSILV